MKTVCSEQHLQHFPKGELAVANWSALMNALNDGNLFGNLCVTPQWIILLHPIR